MAPAAVGIAVLATVITALLLAELATIVVDAMDVKVAVAQLIVLVTVMAVQVGLDETNDVL